MSPRLMVDISGRAKHLIRFLLSSLELPLQFQSLFTCGSQKCSPRLPNFLMPAIRKADVLTDQDYARH